MRPGTAGSFIGKEDSDQMKVWKGEKVQCARKEIAASQDKVCGIIDSHKLTYLLSTTTLRNKLFTKVFNLN